MAFKQNLAKATVLTGLAGAVAAPAQAQDSISLTVPSIGTYQYHHELIQKSLTNIGVDVTLNKKDPSVPQTRLVRQLQQDKLDLMWLVESDARQKKYTEVPVNTTNSLIGHRILFVTPGTADDYKGVDNLKEFRQLNKTGGFGKGWFDVKVWKANNLDYYEQPGDWKVLYRKVRAGNRGVDYFSRGVTEILPESKEYPKLQIEPNLLLKYERDFRYYLSDAAAEHKDVLTEALKQAKSSGLIDELVRKHNEQAFKKLNVEDRTVIDLKTPS